MHGTSRRKALRLEEIPRSELSVGLVSKRVMVGDIDEHGYIDMMTMVERGELMEAVDGRKK
jgi:hypothetical protein